MSVDVVYQNMSLARDAGTRVEDNGLFIETDTPMPVSSRLVMIHGDRRTEVKVARVHEGVGAGMLVRSVDGKDLPRWVQDLQPQAVEMVEMVAEPQDGSSHPPGVVSAPVPVVSSGPVVVSAPVAVPTPVAAAVSAPVAAAAPAQEPAPPLPASAPVEAASSATPPYEATQEFSVPSLDEADGERKAAAAGTKKKKPGRKR